MMDCDAYDAIDHQMIYNVMMDTSSDDVQLHSMYHQMIQLHRFNIIR